MERSAVDPLTGSLLGKRDGGGAWGRRHLPKPHALMRWAAPPSLQQRDGVEHCPRLQPPERWLFCVQGWEGGHLNGADFFTCSSASPGSRVLTEESVLIAVAFTCRRLQNAYEVSVPHSSLSWLLRRAIPQLDR